MKRKILLTLFWVLGSLCSFGQNSPPVTDGLVAWYPFNGNTNDESGNGLNGVGIDLATTTDRFGNSDQAYQFNGSSSYINVADNGLFQPESFSISVWAFTQVAGNPNVVSKTLPGTFYDSWAIGLQDDSKELVGAVYGTFPTSTYSRMQTPVNVWHHYVMTFDRATSRLKVYIDGILKADVEHSYGSIRYNSGGLAIGWLPASASNYFNGKLDDIAFYNKALSSLQVTQMFMGDMVALPGSGKAIQLDGTDDHIYLGNDFTAENFTINMWLKPGETQNTYADIIDNNHTGNTNWVAQQNESNVNIYHFGVVGSEGAAEITFSLEPNKWQHLSIVKSPTVVSVYIDGNLIGSSPWSGTINYSGTQLRLGAWGGGGRNWNGVMDEVTIWDVGLTEQQIKDRMCHKIAPDDALYGNLLRYYNFDEETAFTARDIKSGLNGELINGPVWVTSGAPIADLANAGPDQTDAATCNLTTVTLAANVPLYGTGAWSIVSGTGAGGSFADATNPTSTFSGTAGTAYVLKWTITNEPCAASEDEVTIKFNQLPTVANAGTDQTGSTTCGLTTVTLAGNTPVVGIGAWSIVSGTGGSFSDAASPTSTFSGTAGATYVLKWTISNAPCAASEDQVTITFNQLPTLANAGTDQTGAATCGLTMVTLAGNTPAVGTGAWSIVSGTGGSFADASNPTSTFSGTAGATYVLKWTISNAPCATSGDEVTIRFNLSPTVANAGTDQTGSATCGLTSVTLAGNTPTVGTGIWSVVSGTGGNFANASNPTTTFSGTAGTTYVLKWEILNAPCATSEDQVTIRFNQLPTVANAGTDQTSPATCGLTTVTLAGNTPTVGTGIWSVVSGTGGNFANASNPTTTFSGTAGTTYVLKWEILNAPCATSEDEVTIKFHQSPTAANAGADQTGAATCGLTSVTLTGNTPSVGTGAWSIISGTGGSFADASNPTSTFSGTAGTTYVLKWAINNAPCAVSEDEVTIKFNVSPTIANAGTDQTGAATCGLTMVTLAGNTPTVGTGAWSIVSGTGGSFGDASNPTSTFSGIAGTTYVLKWEISNAPCAASEDEVTIKFNQSSTVANAGADQTGTATCGLTMVTLAGNMPTVGNGVWSIVSGTGGSFGDASSPTSTFSGTAGTTYVLKWEISNAPCAASEDEVTIKFNVSPTIANAGTDQTGAATCGLTMVTLAGNTPAVGIGSWSIVSGTGGSFADVSSPVSTFSGTAGVTYVLRWSIRNLPCLPSTDDVTIQFSNDFTLSQNGDIATLLATGPVVNQALTAEDCRLVATVSGNNLSNGTDPFTATVTIDEEVGYFGEQPYLQRHFIVTPGGTMPLATMLTLYVSKEEMIAFNNESTVKLPAETTDSKDKLRILVWHENTPSGSPDEIIEPGEANIQWDATLMVWKITFQVNAFSSFYISAEDAISLPVKLISFNASLNGERNANLQWSTSEESNASHYAIQRSIDAVNWQEIGRLSAAGESSVRQSYSFVDRLSEQNPGADIVYYRLEMVDLDKTRAYSRATSIQIGRGADIVIYPNPATGKTINVSFSDAIPVVSLTDMTGRKISVEIKQVSPNRLEVSPKNSIPSGLYFISTTQQGLTKTHKVLMVE